MRTLLEETLTLLHRQPIANACCTCPTAPTYPRLSVSRKDREVLLDQRKAEYKNARLLSVSAAFAAHMSYCCCLRMTSVLAGWLVGMAA